MYIASGQDREIPGVNLLFKNVKLQSILSFAARYPNLPKEAPHNLALIGHAISLSITVFPIQTYRRPNMALLLNRSWSTQDHNVFKLCRAGVPDVAC